MQIVQSNDYLPGLQSIQKHIEERHIEDDDDELEEVGINPKLLKKRPANIKKSTDIRNYMIAKKIPKKLKKVKREEDE